MTHNFCKPTLLVPIALFLLSAPRASSCQHQNETSKSLMPLSTILGQDPSVTSNVYEEPNKTKETLSESVLRTYVRINSMRAYHLDLHSYRDDAKFVGDPVFVDSLSEDHKFRCASHLQVYERLLRTLIESDPVSNKVTLESIRLADSFGRPEAGVLLGNQFWLGSYDSCLDFKLKQERAQSVKGQYCLGLSQFINWPKDGKTSIKVGLCLPETCSSSMINENPELLKTVETMMKYQIGSGLPFSQVHLREVYCLPHETSEIRQYSQSATYFFILIGAIVAANVIATTIHYCSTKLPENLKSSERTWRTIIIESFSIKKNLDKFLHVKEDSPTNPSTADGQTSEAVEPAFDKDTFLNSMTGLKCIGLFWIICAHTFLVSPIPNKNVLHADKLTQTYLASVYLTAHLMVDTFFALSGVLAAFFLFKEGVVGTMSNRGWIILTLHRYWRLTPIYLLCYWFTKSVGFLINTGPMWDYMTAEQSPRLNCNRESWLEAILHLSDFKSPKEHCVPFAWFIANGIKFWMVTPIFMILIHKSMRRGYMAIFGTMIANIILVTTLAMQSNVDVKSLIEFKPESADNMLNNMTEVYTRPYSRISPYLIGLIAGHLMYLVDSNKLEVNLSKNAKSIIWTFFTITVIALTFVLKIAAGMPLGESAVRWVFGITSALIRPLWAICTCWLVFALALGQARWFSKFLSARCWRILVKLSFCAYLAQGEVIAQLFLSATSSDSFNYIDLISRPIVIIALTLAVSFVMVILIEYPLCGIEEMVLPRRSKAAIPNPNLVEGKMNKTGKFKAA